MKPLSSQDRLWVGGLQIGVGGLQIGVSGFRLAWVASDQNGVVGDRGGVGSRGVVDGHGWPRVLLLVGVFGWLEFQRCFNGVSGWME